MKALKVRRKNRKGQTSIEYLVLLAIAIVISVVAVGVLAGFIKIGTAGTYKKKGLIYWKAADVGIMDWEIYDHSSSNRDSILLLENNKEYEINLDWISTDGGTTTYAIDQRLLPGGHYKLETTYLNCSSGGSYSFEITFQFDNREYAIEDKRFTGAERVSGDCSDWS
ncbi:class III signal peptide-containing protein [Candidatus Altiarchaeota archaeon]